MPEPTTGDRFDPTDRAFLQDPYPSYARLRAVPIAWYAPWPRGTKLVLHYAAANRDPEMFVDPDRFDVGRDPNPHLAFGLGLHYGIGAPLARLELGLAIGALLRRLPELRLVGPEPTYVPKNVFRYLTALRVAF